MRWWTRAFGGNARLPRSVDAALRSALLAVLDRDLDRAERMLTHAAQIDADAEEPFQALARLFRMRGEIGRAIGLHQRLLLRADLNTARGVALLADLAADFHQGGFLRRSIACYEEVLGHDPRHRGALRALARLLAESRDFSRALEMERRLARLESRGSGMAEAALQVEMAAAARAEGRNQEARRALKKALRKDRRLLRAWLMLGELEAERGRSKAALAAWTRVPELDLRSGPQVYPQIEATYAALGRSRDFETFLRGLLEKDPEDAGARLALARTLAARGEVQAGIGELRRILDRDLDHLEARGTLGRILLSEHRDREAISEYAKLLDTVERQGSRRPPEVLD